jgi:class 3 adenylate cyclase
MPALHRQADIPSRFLSRVTCPRAALLTTPLPQRREGPEASWSVGGFPSQRMAWDTHAVDIPDVHYARAGGVAVAYQVVGEGPQTLVFSPQISDLATIWLRRDTHYFLDRLAERVRLVVLNPRGTGFSDRPRNVTLEARMDDITSVLDDLDVARASLMGNSTSANVCALFAASYPDRVEHLILAHPFPRGMRSESYPWGRDEEGWHARLREVRQHWGDRDFLDQYARTIAPHLSEDADEIDLVVLGCRLALSPTAAHDWFRIGMETDIVGILSSIRVPTLVLHRPDDPTNLSFGAGPAHLVAELVRGSRKVALSSDGSTVFSEEAVDAILEFLGGEAPLAVPDTVLATVLFTDLVGSTERAAALGDRAWRDLLTRHHGDVRRELARFRGEEVDTAGDGFFCRFDGPARAMACARAIVDGATEHGLAVRSGIHTGECELVGDKIAGIAVVTGARISSLAAPGEVLVSSTVKDLVAGSGFSFDERGEHELKGVPGMWRLYAVV